MKTKLLILLPTVLLLACSGGQAASPAAANPASAAYAPAVPASAGAPGTTASMPSSSVSPGDQLAAKIGLKNLDRSDSLQGVDANNNGVRDDIEAWINSLPFNDKQRGYAMEMAMARRSELAVSNSQEALALANTDWHAFNCLSNNTAAMKIEDIFTFNTRLESYTANTYERSKAYLRYMGLISGNVFPLDDNCN